MKIIEKADATASLSDYASGLKKEPVILTSNGKPIAALVSLENTDMETATLCTNPKFIELIGRSRERQRKEGGISSDEMRRRLGVKKKAKA